MVYAKSRRFKSRVSRRHNRKVSVSNQRIAKIARRVMATSAEVKINKYSQNGTLYSPANDIVNFQNVGGNLWCLTPHASFCAISQGTTEADRIGTKIRIKSVRMKLNVWPNAYNVTYNPTPVPFYLKLWIFSVKYSSQLSDVQNVVTNNFMNSNNSSVGLAGTLYDLTGPVNNNYVTLKKVIIRKIGVSSVYGTGAVASAEYHNNNDFKITQFINIDVTKYIRKCISYNDTSTTASTSATWCVAEVIPYNNDTTSIAQQPGKYALTLETRFTDS